MKRLLLALIAAVALTGCDVAKVANTPLDTTTAAKTVYELKLAHAGLLEVAVAYNRLPRCALPASPRICSEQTVVVMLRKANDTAMPALDAAENAARTVGVQTTVLQAAIATAQNAVEAFKVIQTTNKLGAAS